MDTFTYNEKEYAFINEKTVDGVTCTAYRSIDNPKETIVVINGVVSEILDLKSYWK